VTYPDEQWRLKVAEDLGHIRGKVDDTYIHVEALNVTVSSQAQRITALETSWRTIRAVTTGAIAAIAAVAAAIVAWFRVSGD
jgi:hypothetical protein